MKSELFLKNALIATEDDTFHGGVLVTGGKIEAVIRGNTLVDASEVVDLEGKLLFPGLVDAHVHFNEPGRSHWEGYRTGTLAAAAGGITTVLEMPLNSIPTTISSEALNIKRDSFQGQAVVDVAQWGGLVNDNLENLDELHEEGVIGLKGFMCNSGIEDFKHITDNFLYAGLEWSAKTGNVIGVHAENDAVTAYLTKKLQNEGRTDRAAWYEAHPPFEELEAIQRAGYLAQVTGGNLHICHISIPEGVEAAVRYRETGARITVETCPHYLFFTEKDFERIGPAAKCGPPLRSAEKVEALWDCIRKGLVDVIGSDHSPCNWEEKEKGMHNIWQAWGGISGLQTTLPLMLTEGYHKRGIPLSDLSKLLCANPARIFGLYPKKGAIIPGADADFSVVDLNQEWVLKADDLFYKNKHSAYVGETFRGKITRTILRGVTIFENDRILAEPGYGQLLKRSTFLNH